VIDFTQPLGAGMAAPAGSSADPSPDRSDRGDLAGAAPRALLAALNHLLKQQAWASERLRLHAGRCVRLGFERTSPWGRLTPSLCAVVSSEGFLEVAADRSADATLWLEPSIDALFDGLRNGPRGFSTHLQVEGDVMLAATLGELAEHLRWDAEEDASRLLGDVAAHRIASLWRGLAAHGGDTRRRVESAAVQFATVEQPQLVAQPMLASLRGQLSALASLIDSIDLRLAAIDHNRP
jgi:ubiquinone biosynthesis accessory factor UbiJ